MRRFWDSASAAPSGEGFKVLLDGKPMHMPDGTLLRVRVPRLAAAVAAEWQAAGGAKGGEVTFNDMPLTRLAGTAQLRIAPDPAPTIAALARYGETDLLCYRAHAPETLVQRQARAWQPWLDWAAETYDAPLRVTTGVVYIRQSRDSIHALRRVLERRDADVLAALGIAVPALGSLVLGLALADGRLDPGRAHALSALDELFQAEQWGEDAEAAARRAAIADDVALAAQFIALTRREKEQT